MSRILDQRSLLLVISFLTNLQSTKSTKVLSEWKRCGDRECETAMSRVQATADYLGPDCRYLSFKEGEEIIVYSKLSRKSENLWTGSKGKDFGYFPKDAVKVEEVFISEEVEVPTKETDFLCLDGDEYIFENKDSVLHDHDKETEYSSPDAENELLKYTKNSMQEEERVELVSENDSKESHSQEESASKKLPSKNENGKDAEQPQTQTSLPLKTIRTPSSWMVSGIAGWFTTQRKKNEETTQAVTASLEENAYIGRKIVTAENDMEELSDKEEQEPTASGWFQGGLTDFLYFGKEDVDVGSASEKNSPQIHDVSHGARHSDNEHETAVTKALTEEEQKSESYESKSNWFNLGLSDVLNFGQAEKDAVMEDQQHREIEDEANKNEEIWTLKQEESYMDKEPQGSVEVVVDEDNKENFAPEATDSNKETPKEEHEINTDIDSEHNIDKHSKAIVIPSVNTEEEIYSSVVDLPVDVKKPFSDVSSQIQNYFPSNGNVKLLCVMQNLYFSCEQTEGGWIYQILLCLNDFEIGEFVKSVFSAMANIIKKAVASLPEDMRPGADLYGFPWEIVICAGVVGVFTVFLFVYRSYQSVRSRLYVGREKQLANKIAELVEDKCKMLEKLSLCKKEFEDLESFLNDDSIVKDSTDASFLEETHEKLNKSNLELKQEIENLEKELEEEKLKHSENDDLVAEIQKKVESLENEAKSIQSQIAEAKSTLKVFEINTERLKTSVQDAAEENCHLQESEKQLLQEAEGWGERFTELNEQTKMSQSSKADMEEVMKNKESQVKSLTQYLLKMKDWSSAIREDESTEDNHWDTEIKGETENGEPLDDQQKRTIKKLIHAAKLNACLKTLETEREQVYSKLSDENKAKGELTERIESLQTEQASLQSENERLDSEVQKLQQKLKVMTELYQENEMKLHRKLTVEERERLQKEEKLSKVDEKINHAAEELNSYRQRAKDLEEELERTIRSYQHQITSHEKKAHDNWLTARAAERHLNDIRKENAHNRQKLTETEFKLDLLEKDPYALDVPVRPFGREHSPYGPSPMGRPSSETRAFLSPPTLLEGPLRLSPMLPGGGGGRGSRGPGTTVMYEGNNERGELSSDRLTDPHRPPSDTGSLSPPWDRERRIVLPLPGEPYTDPIVPLPPPRRQDRFLPNPPNSGRLSGPAELRTYNMQSFDTTENSSQTEPSGNEMKDHSNLGNLLPDQSFASESEAGTSGFAPPPFPPVRAPMLPMDPRGPFMRRGPPFPPPPPPGMYGPRECFPVRDFGLPQPPLP
ncbi:cTAGE family member 5, partial [Tinamus guttatus]